MTITRVKHILAAAAGLTILGGCSWFHGGSRPQDLDASRRFSPPPLAPARSTPGGVDEPGFVPPPTSAGNPDRATGEPAMQGGPAGTDVGGGGGAGKVPSRNVPRATGTGGSSANAGTPSSTATPPRIPDVIKEQVGAPSDRTSADTSPNAPAPPAPAVHIATSRPGASYGTFLTLGGVVAEVNQRPIYANQVLREIVGPLSARARELDEDQFRKAAADLIDQQIKRLANAERETAVAERNLDEAEKQQARAAAARWRQRQITENGGSLELAKRKWAADGYDFEERVDQEYRALLAQLYYSKRVWPRVQVTADEIRRYYDQHLADEFTVRDQVRFQVIKIDVKRTGGREQALAKITDLRNRALRGEDFGALAGSVNDDKYLMSQKGDVGWVQKGSYAVTQVEKAAWDLQPGAISDIIDTGNAFYLARVEERKLGRVMPFDEQAVQEKIVKNLKAKQFGEMRDKVIDTLIANSVVRRDEHMIDSAIDIAMQNYPRWHGESQAQ